MTARASGPFGILEPIHAAGLRGQPVGSPASWLHFAIIPLVPIYLQAYLLVGDRSTRGLRAALGVLSLGLMWRAWSGWRFDRPEHNAFNNGFTIIFIHLALKAVEFGLLKENVNDPYMRTRGRSRSVAALDVCLNSRLVSLGSIGLDTAAGARNATITEIRVERHLRHGRKHRHVHPVSRNGHDSGNGNSNGNGKAIAKAIANANGAAIVANEAAGISNSSPGTPSPSPSPGSLSPRPHKHDAYTHEDLHRPTTRSGAIARHATHAFVHYAVLDTMLALLRKVGPDTLAVTHASTQTGLFAAFVKQTGITVLPGILDWDVPSVLVEVWTQCCVPLIIWQALSCGYHVIATLALSTTLWEVRSWDVDLFHAPWAADSLIDLWGKRWHQLFRHQFIMLSSSTLNLLHLPTTPFTLFPLTFFFSGALHALGELSMSPVPAPLPLASFFWYMGAGCAAEVILKRLTGRRVRGPLGRVWTWCGMFAAGRVATDAWFDAGIAGNILLPENGLGEVVARWLLGWAFEVYPRV